MSTATAKVYGTASLVNGVWELRCEPHVAMVAKRVCQGISKGEIGVLRLTHTPEHCVDLRWLMERYPLDVEPRAALETGAARHAEHVLRLADLLAGHTPPPAFPLALPPREYQATAAAVARASGALLLADAVGVGKTCTAIATVADPALLPALIVVPVHLMGQWAAEFARFAPHLRTWTTPGTRPKPMPTILGQGPDVVITAYSRIHGWAQVLGEYCRSVVYDEVHALRHSGNDKGAAAAHLASMDRITVRLGMSATPIYNYGSEFYSVLEALAPGRLGTWSEFRREWCGGDMASDKATIRNPEAFGSWLRDQGLMLRRTRADVGRELPPATMITQTVDTDPEALEAISAEVGALARILLGQVPTVRGDAFRAGGELDWKLRQATGMAKAPAVAAFVQMLVEGGEPVLLGGWHRAVYDVWMAAFTKAGLRVVMYTGSESPTAKQHAVAAWLAGEVDVFIISLRSGEGLDGLQTRGSVVVMGEIDWSPAVHEQLIGRLARDGQPSPVMAYFLVSDEGSDPVIAEALGLKRGQIDGVLRRTDDVATSVQGDGDHIKRLAMRFLETAPVSRETTQPREVAHADRY